MLSAEVATKKRKKKVNLDETVIVKKKKKKNLLNLSDPDVSTKTKKKKKKKKKIESGDDAVVITSTQKQPDDGDGTDISESMDFPASQSPIAMASPSKKIENNKKALYHSPIKDNDSSDAPLQSPSPVKKSPKKRVPTSSFPIKFAKKTKIIPDEDARKVSDSDSDVLSIDEDKVFSEAESEVAAETAPQAMAKAPLTDVLFTREEQNTRDLALITEVDKLYGHKTDDDIDWDAVKVYDLTPADAAARYHELTCHIGRVKSVTTVAMEFYRGFCMREVEDRVPRTQRNLAASRGIHVGKGKSKIKRMNAFMIFAEQNKISLSKEDIKSKWDLLDKHEKNRLQTEARNINIKNGLIDGKVKKQGKGKVNAYSLFTRDQLQDGIKMADVGALWRGVTPDVKERYKEMAIKMNAERALEEGDKDPNR